ncbi:MAG: GNAT family N-acetyltransferase [Lachnospiraceae bacterium]|nr:GNAT family N-acetyltransferase [Lachnospiraceae bacterium]
MDVMIRRAQPEDAGAIIAYMNTVGSETDNLSYGNEGFPISQAEEADLIREKNKSPRNALFLAVKGKKIVGKASIEALTRRMAHRAEFGISVVKAEWGKGTGSKLLETIVQHAKLQQIEIIELEVRSDNERAIQLYKKYGFVKIGVYPKYFKMSDNSYVDFDLMNLYL